MNLLGATVGGFGYEVTVKELSLSRLSRICLNASTDAWITNGIFWHVRATDALTVDPGEGQVELYWQPIVRGNEHYRFPILTGPASSTFTADDFKITLMPNTTLYNLDLHLEVGDGPDGRVGAGEKREDLLQADVLDFVEDGMPRRLAEAQVEESARAAEAPGKRHGREAVARLAPDHLDRLQDELLAPPRAAGGASTHGEERGDEKGFWITRSHRDTVICISAPCLRVSV